MNPRSLIPEVIQCCSEYDADNRDGGTDGGCGDPVVDSGDGVVGEVIVVMLVVVMVMA